MNNKALADIRTFAIAGHTGSGKTTLTDAILYKLGMNDRLGSVASGSSMADYTSEEKERKTTVFAKPFCGNYKTKGGREAQLTFIDTPGYADFFGQVISALQVADAMLLAVDAVGGLQIGSAKVWREAGKRGLARGVVVTGLDRENADFRKALGDIQSVLGSNCVPVLLPSADGKGVTDVLDANVPAGAKEEADKAKSSLMELAAETDDKLIEKFLGGGSLSPEELNKGLREAVRKGGLVPVFACMPIHGAGVPELMEGIVRLFPSPQEVERKDSGGNVIASGQSDPFVGMIWRVVNDEFVGQLAFARVFGGTLRSDSEIHNSSRQEKERIGSLILMNGKKQETVKEASAGDIIALPKLKATGLNDTLCAPGGKTVCEKMKFPNPVMFQAVKGKTQADEDKIGVALARVCDEDPTLKVDRNAETKEIVLEGLGDVHIDLAVERMRRRSNVDVTLSIPKVPYRETVTGTGEGHYKHKKQSGGRGQYGEVYLRVQPKKEDDEEWFVDAIVGGVIPGNFIPAIQKGLLEGMTSGALAGYKVTNVKVTVYDGSYHDVDSSEIAFKIAGSRALKDGMMKAKPVLLEPIMTVKVSVPDQFMGDINGDLNHRRGRILGMGSEDGVQVVTADVPQAELFRYAAELRSMTAGQGSFEMEFSRYDVVPSNIAQKVIAEAQKSKTEEE